MKIYRLNRLFLILLIIAAFCGSYVRAEQSGWQRKKVDWLAGPGGRIKAIRFPEEKNLLQKSIPNDRLFSLESAELQALDNNIDSPPVAGFVPRIAVVVTNKHSDDYDWVAETHMSVAGNYLTNDPESDFIIGLFDTGAAAHIMSYTGANRAGIYDADLVTPSSVEIVGAVNSVFGRVSQPLALFIDGLAAIDHETMTVDDSNMVGQSNVSIIVGDEPPLGGPDLPTAIGSPMSVNFVTAIFNDNQISVTYDGNNYTSPDIRFYDHSDSRIPDYADRIPLNLIPSGAVNIQYIPDYEAIFELIFRPGTPSTIIGNLAQSLFFVSSVDLQNEDHSAIDKDRFMLDTGAQITVVGSVIGARLGLNPTNPDFEVDIQDVTGEITVEPGFFIDSLEITALGDWLRFTNVPVVMLDVASPEGGYLDGIIGMNLFTEFNLVLRGGGLLGQDPPSLEFKRIPARLTGDIAPETGDGVVDFLDLASLAEAWLATPTSSNWNIKANLAPRYSPDSIINFLDFTVFAENWLDSTPQ
ncbi:MAG: clan AA aspartic protease [Sedimentisphaerales bacterium]|nr:clan AA aspartic protease [Sedimentisphaerales bacterium]